MGRAEGFTLIEVVVVLAVVVLLMAILLPLLGKSRESARQAKCGVNLRQVGMAITAYSNENNSFFPAAGDPQYNSSNTIWDGVQTNASYGYNHYGRLLNPFLNNEASVLFCPSAVQYALGDPNHGASKLGVDAAESLCSYWQRGANQGSPKTVRDTEHRGLIALMMDLYGYKKATNHDRLTQVLFLDVAVRKVNVPSRTWRVTDADGNGGDFGGSAGAWTQVENIVK